MLALALEGLSLVSVGQIDAGMRRLDAAAASAVGGEMTDADSIESVCCFLIDACKRVRDLERASEWCTRVEQIAERFGDRGMFALYTASIFHCMSVSLANGGPGLGTMWGEQNALEILGAAGFGDVEVKRVAADFLNNYYIARKP